MVVPTVVALRPFGNRSRADRDQYCPVIVDGTRCISLLFLELSIVFAVFDLSSSVALSHFPLAPTRRRLAHAQRSLRLLPTDQLSAQTRVRLRIKPFYGTSPNAAKTQVSIDIFMHVLVAIIRQELKEVLSLHEILQILSVSLFEKTPTKWGTFARKTRF